MGGTHGIDTGALSKDKILWFPPFYLDPTDERLWLGGRPVALKPKPFAVLLHLATHAGRLVSKQELLDTIWLDVHVGDGVLKTAIKEIRSALGDSIETPRFIATVHRRGYRFIPRVEARDRPAPDPTPSVSGPLPSLFAQDTSRPLPLVGRRKELCCLTNLLTQTLHGGRRLALVTGPPGIGKSALLDTFLASLADRQQLWLVRGQCLPHVGLKEPYLPVLEALGSLCLEPGGAAVQSALARYAPAWLAQLPALLTDGELDALRRRASGMGPERMLRQMAEAIEALSLERPVVLCFDDLQWCDRATLELIDTLVRRQPKARLLVVGAYRSAELTDAHHPVLVLKREMQIRSLCEELALEPLPKAATEAYLASRFGADDARFPSFLPRLLHEQSGGHPLFMTAIIDTLVRRNEIVHSDGRWSLATPIRKLALPASISAFVAGEFERLDANLQQLLEAASVLGPEFSVTELTAALAGGTNQDDVESWATTLARRQLFLETVNGSESTLGSATARFAFRHDLYREVVYAQLTQRRRSSLHRCVGNWREQAFGSRAKEIAGTLAMHFQECGDWLRAASYHRLAGEQAQQRHAPRAAAEHARRGIAIIRNAPPSHDRAREELLLQQLIAVALITSNGFAAAELSQIYARADELCQEVEDLDSAIVVLCGFWNLALNQGDGVRAHEVTEQLLSLAEKHPEPVALLQAHSVAAQMRLSMGMFEAAKPHLQRCRELYDFEAHRHLLDLYGENPEVVSRLAAGWVEWIRGHPDRGRDQVEDALGLGRAIGHPFVVGQALWGAAVVHQLCGDIARVHAYAEELIRLCRKTGTSLWLAGARTLRGWALVRDGRTKPGIASLRRGINQWRATGTMWLMPYHLGLLTDALFHEGALEEASSVLERARTIAGQTGERWYDAELYRFMGEHRRRCHDRGMAETCLRQALDISRRQSAKSWELRAATSLAVLWREQGRESEAYDLLEPVCGYFAEGFETTDFKNAQALLDALS